MNETGFGSVDAVAKGAFLYSIPANAVLMLMAAPVFYFSHLAKQERYCMNAVHVNRMYNADPLFWLRGAAVLIGVLIQNAERGIE